MRNYWFANRPERPGWYLMATSEFMTIVPIDIMGIPNPPETSDRTFYHGPIPRPFQQIKMGVVRGFGKATALGVNR